MRNIKNLDYPLNAKKKTEKSVPYSLLSAVHAFAWINSYANDSFICEETKIFWVKLRKLPWRCDGQETNYCSKKKTRNKYFQLLVQQIGKKALRVVAARVTNFEKSLFNSFAECCAKIIF